MFCEMAELLRIDEFLKLLKAKGKPDLVTLNFGDKIDHAIKLMIGNAFSQLPVKKDGEIVGIISYGSIVRALLFLEKKNERPIDLLRVKVEDLMEKPCWRNYDSDLFDLLDKLAIKSFIQTKTEDGTDEIITSYDAIDYFRGLAESFLALNDIENCLRHIIHEKFDESSFKEKARIALSYKKNGVPGTVNDLDFGGYITFVSYYWKKFSEFFGDRKMFLRYLEKARNIRNDICHFRGPIAESDKEALKFISNWLKSKKNYRSDADLQ
jgi:CBS domain-containing protein